MHKELDAAIPGSVIRLKNVMEKASVDHDIAPFTLFVKGKMD
jgi:hypothetical protein